MEREIGGGGAGFQVWLVYLEHGLLHTACLDNAMSGQIFDELDVSLAAAAPGHGGVEKVLGLGDERFEL